MNFTQPVPLSLYVHYPWCIQKCPYCDFNSHTLKEDQEQKYIQAMVRQLEQTLPDIWGRPIQSIFFGGGTPSLMSEAGLDAFLSQARALLGFQPDIEITLEANPGTVDFEKFSGFRQAGVNRLSMGIQSFDDEKLRALGRIHSSDEAYQAVEAAKSAGFDNFNLDLMFALPNQTLAQAVHDVETALALEPPHMSHYQLTLEPNTPFYKNPPVLPEEDLAWEMQEACQTALSKAGYHHYEVSAYAKKDQACRHNLNYWQFGDYIGLGAGAHGKITQPPIGEIWRTQMPASPGSYMNMIEAGDMGRQHVLSDDDALFEFMLNALRLQDGFPLTLFTLRTGLPLEVIEPQLEKMISKGWAEQHLNELQLTQTGKTYLNEVLQLFLS
ncbi:Oxygen-independent coproporphyrinogen-III oxidase-like protein YqeR [Hydrogenovibrio crunogenus]|uniref:Heme chaperone HemW n=1 Tax=Hydrogenovibrio crunogenus TaxID=39765 RepID=A0A4P7NWL1_9GAMM|nr:radical SAM family heme chaperone HemW [Hydrogenovibrio crunogenus]QBZ82083.1 Oxygen-independent coproporphyrinogen-III oxidase-like protein YqeR [Hydrogenovibrio crunogenus]